MTDESLTVASEWHPSKGDQYRALCDYLKHVATLSAGSILLVATMLEKMFAQPSSRGWVSLAVGSFLVSLMASSVAFLMVAVMFPRANAKTPNETEKTMMAGAVILTCAGFVIGVASIAFFF